MDLIASHGHTFYHLPAEELTFQLGNGPEIYTTTGIPTACDFRRQDVSLGGQGAPLVPIGDALLFPDMTACLNLGGFANISTNHQKRQLAFDICAVNYVLNHLTRQLGQAYDTGGKIAAGAKVNPALLSNLNKLSFYQQEPPKSLGAEWVFERILPVLQQSELSVAEKIATYTEHAAVQIAEVLRQQQPANCLVTGGGAYNNFLIQLINKKTDCELVLPRPQLIDFKEALIFALMGVLRWRGEVNISAAITGSKRDHSSGILYGSTKS
ncbi:MAG: anhydro-N-acetylmuramic acid kinase [Owenweeksia sp.]|nr:anhydro-N-acetylmuramic acid kinase [Owenweeksia sp.]